MSTFTLPPDRSFKNDFGVHFIKALFIEWDADRNTAIYTLSDKDRTIDGRFYPSLGKLYLEMEDPTEYIFSCSYLDGYVHWKKLCNSGIVSPFIKEWREQLELKIRAQALNNVRKKAENSQDKESFQANKFLLSGQWKTPEEKAKVGRPSKATIRAEADKLVKEQSVFDEDFERIMSYSTEMKQ